MNIQGTVIDYSLRLAEHFREAEPVFSRLSSGLLNQGRKKALAEFVRQGIPGRKNENYKYTNLQPSFAHDFDWIHRRDGADFRLTDAFKCDVPQMDTHLMVLLNGWYHSFQPKSGSQSGGWLNGSLEQVSREHPELLQKYYGKLADGGEDPMTALNTLFATDGFVVHIPAGIKLEHPLQVINILQAPASSFVTQRNLVIVEPGAEVKLIICDHTLNLNHYVSNSVTEVFIGEGASADFYTIQNQHNNTTSVHSAYFHLGRDSRLTTQTITLHGGLVRNNLNVILDGENGEANLYGMAFMDKRQHVDNFVRVEHNKPNCRSNQHFKNVLDDESSGAFSGRIHVQRDAQKTNAYQRNNNLLLTDKALMQTKPQLIIEADDVKCSHGATIGQIDEEALFYLRTRGIPEKQARLTLMNAFSYEVVRQITVKPLRDRISELVDKRLRGDVGRCHDCAYHCEC